MRERLTDKCVSGGAQVAFLCLFLLSDLDGCIKLLCETGRVPEAAFMARTYLPSKASEVVALWREDLAGVNKKAAEALVREEAKSERESGSLRETPRPSSLRTDNSPQPKEAQPLSHALTSD
jgi:hypothetical protein